MSAACVFSDGRPIMHHGRVAEELLPDRSQSRTRYTQVPFSQGLREDAVGRLSPMISVPEYLHLTKKSAVISSEWFHHPVPTAATASRTRGKPRSRLQ